MSREYPRFAVVGHPNKGKSSIVATLAHDESVQISNIPGTTTKQRAFPLKIDGKILYELYDTPGFQRARATLAWLKKEEVSAHQKPKRVRKFLYEHRDDPRFNDEVELLEPILAGAGIIYVVDGSKPYGAEYEAEMEILRWTGQPSMALINLIDDSNFVEEWREALGQYFRMVRFFNPMEANFAQHIALLESIAQLKEEWTVAVKESIEIFIHYQEQKIEESSLVITRLMYDALSYVASLSIASDRATEEEREKVLEKYRSHLRQLEEHAHKKIAQIWHHHRLQKGSTPALFEKMDLFSKESASLFGLDKKELIITGAGAGASTGAAIDLMVGGSSFMLGSALGGLIGGVGAAFGFGEISDMKILGQKLGTQRVEVGPMQNRNFPYILLQRTLYYTHEIASRPHADRSKIPMDSNTIAESIWLLDDEKKEMQSIYRSLRNGSTIRQKEQDRYQEIISTALKRGGVDL